MKNDTKVLYLVVIVAIALWHNSATCISAGQSFYDDFEDGNHEDSYPVTWSTYPEPFNDGTFGIENGSLVLTPFTSGPPTLTGVGSYWEVDTYAAGQQYHDVDIRTQVRGLVDATGTLVGIGGLDTEATAGPSGSGVWGNLLLDGATQELNLGYNLGNGSGVNIGKVTTQLSHIADELNLRFTITGLNVSFKAWPVGTPEPAVQLRRTLPQEFADLQGHVTLFAGNRTTAVPIAFRYVDVHSDPTMVSPLTILPASEYAVQDIMNDGVMDNLGDAVAGYNGVVGEFDISVASLNYIQRLVEKFTLPSIPGLASRLRHASLRVHSNGSQNGPVGPLSVFHSVTDNDLSRDVADYEDVSYLDLQHDILQPSDAGTAGYFELDVTEQILLDLNTDGTSPLSAFRLQVDNATFVEDNLSHYYSVASSRQTMPPVLVLTFDPLAIGDFTADGLLTTADIDLLVTQIAGNSADAEFDLTSDGRVDNDDITQWLVDAAAANGLSESYFIGDTNLDGAVDFQDFVNLNNNWQKSQLESGDRVAWSSGDFNADGRVDFADFVGQNNNWQRTIGMAGTTAAVPEPSSAVWTLAIVLATLNARRR